MDAKPLNVAGLEGVVVDPPTPTPGRLSATGALILSAQAAPNLSRDGEAVHFRVELRNNAQVRLFLYSVMGETVYSAEWEGNSGLSEKAWDLRNSAGSQVASGLYVYVLQAVDGATTETFTGKLAILK